ncbi:MAG: hypothetical protein K0S07_1289 [Chlamydiales bacterium]|nr:hypothetical protein [Chlamydiales bacterium]
MFRLQPFPSFSSIINSPWKTCQKTQKIVSKVAHIALAIFKKGLELFRLGISYFSRSFKWAQKSERRETHLFNPLNLPLLSREQRQISSFLQRPSVTERRCAAFRELFAKVAKPHTVNQDREARYTGLCLFISKFNLSTFFLEKTQVIETLFDLGGDFTQNDHWGWGNTPLMWAIANASNSVADRILKVAAAREIALFPEKDCPERHNTALHLAVGKGYRTVSMHGDALEYSNFDLVKQMVALGADVNAPDRDSGYTPLHLACLRRDREMIDFLVMHGAQNAIRDRQGLRPFDLLHKTYLEAYEILKKEVHVFFLDESLF